MIPAVVADQPVTSQYLSFLAALREAGFQGDISPDPAQRLALATDNSLYQRLPQGALYPQGVADLQCLARLAQRPRYREIVLTPRGGGTGTNGQSLTDGLVVDLSRHMNRILEIDAEAGWVRVESGVVKDQLNAALKPHGLFFAPELSTSNRATLGGMINTDASGQGSCLYGKTRDHVLGLKSVLLDGSVLDSEPLAEAEETALCAREGRAAELARTAARIAKEHAEAISSGFPALNRCLTGYDLAHIRDDQGRLDLNALLCGSEGTLAFIAEARLRVLPIPPCSALALVGYPDFDAALRDARHLMATGPTSIETVDSGVLALARADAVWTEVAEFFPEADAGIAGVNLVEFTAFDAATLNRALTAFEHQLENAPQPRHTSLGFARGEAAVKRVWAMRKRAVGLLGARKGERRPLPFVEDTAVPPEHLADFIGEFRALLDAQGLAYGMFGHVDAGVLHVRPALDMKVPEDAALIRPITDAVVALTQKYGGLLWGEHGKGIRSEYAPRFFGPELYGCLQQIKAVCDPGNQLNPGKICTPAGSSATLLAIDAVPTRGEQDRQIPAPVRAAFADALHCNGNGACFNYDPDDAMCPSWKATRDRVHSPKGRAALMREWLRLMAHKGVDLDRDVERNAGRFPGHTLLRRLGNEWRRRCGEPDFSHEVMDAMAGCLACKSCASQCPVKVNVPDFRARFLAFYYGRYLRPLRHYLVGGLEQLLPWAARMPGLYNRLLDGHSSRAVLRAFLGLVDNPLLSRPLLGQRLEALNVPAATPAALAAIPAQERCQHLVLVQDAFTSHFEAELVADCCELLQRLGFRVWMAPYRANGKPLQVHGFLQRFARTAERNSCQLRALAESGVALVGLDPAMTLTYRQEYPQALGQAAVPEVALLQEWLAGQSDRLKPLGPLKSRAPYRLLSHCTERTQAAQSVAQWQEVFASLGLTLEHRPSGCCGMAGTYGHEAEHQATSRRIYDLSWGPQIAAEADTRRLLATGYSCRSQVKRFDELQLQHPAQALLQALQA